MIVRGTENQLSTLRDGGEDVLTITEVDLAFSDATVKAQAETAEEVRSSAAVVTTVGPIGAAVLGLVLLALGIFLARVPRDDVPRTRGRRAAAPGEAPVVFSKG